MKEDRLSQTVEFCKLIDKEKFVQRRTYLSDGERLENDAEHAWHMALMAILLSEYSNEEIDVLKTITMVLIHDLVEIYAGDTYAYDDEAQKTQKEREQKAADKIFGILPDDQKNKLRAVFEEFEAYETPESRFAHVLDNFQPMMLNDYTDGKAWREHEVRESQIMKRNEKTSSGSKVLWEYAKKMFIEKNIEKGNIIK